MIKKKPTSNRRKAVSEVHSPEFSTRQLVEALFAIPEIRQELEQESFTRADIELALDDRGWLTPNARTFQELDPATRNIKISQSRMYWTADPLAKQAVRLWTDYSLGEGLTYTCDKTDVQSKLDDFMEDQRNIRLTSTIGQRRSSHKLLIDGDVFFIFFRNTSDAPIIRYLDPLQVEEIITGKDDSEQILGYKRKDAQGEAHYYRDWAAEDSDLADAVDPQTKDKITWDDDQDQVVYHLAFDSLDKRGNGLLTSVLGWTREHRRFMEARVAITQSLAKFAWKLTAKVGQKGIDAITSRMASSLSSTGFTGAPEKNPPPSPAATYVTNQGADIVPMPRATGAGDSATDSDQLKLMVCAGTGIFLHYMGDPSTGNLATATAMELPMLKMFRAYQKQWKDAWRHIFAIVLGEDVNTKRTDRAAIEVSWPAILEEDLAKSAPYLQTVTSIWPEAKVPQLLRRSLESLELDNLDEVMTDIEANRVEIDKQNAINQQMEMERLKTANSPPPGPSIKESEAIDRLTAALSDGNKLQPLTELPQPLTVEVVTPLAETQMANVIKEVTETLRLMPPRKKSVKLLRDAEGAVLGAEVLEIEARV